MAVPCSPSRSRPAISFACRAARITGLTSAATGESARFACSRRPPAGPRTIRTAASIAASSRCASARSTFRRPPSPLDVVTFRLHEHGVRVVLLDIEGTTTPMSFVYDVLFPYARARLSSYLRAHASEDELRDMLATLRVEWHEDARKGEDPPDWALADIPAAARYLDWLMDRDRKSPSLKRIQGDIWKGGFDAGELRGELFGDVAPAFARWKQERIDI